MMPSTWPRMRPPATEKPNCSAVGPVALAGVEIEPGRAQPADRQVLQRMADGEDAQGPAAEIGALVLRRRGELELQRPLAGMAEAGAAEIVARRRRGAFGLERGIDQRVDAARRQLGR